MLLMWFLSLTGALAESREVQVETATSKWLGGEIFHHRLSVEGLPVDGPPVVTVTNGRGEVLRSTGTDTLVAPDSLTPVVSAETATEEVWSGWHHWPRNPPHLVVFQDESMGRLSWRFQVYAAGMNWLVWVDAQDGRVFRAEADSWSMPCFIVPIL